MFVEVEPTECLEMFISSTIQDLKEERDTVENVIKNRFKYRCFRSETASVPGKSPQDACLYLANKCDVYMGIFGDRYGTINTKTGNSMVESEFLEAQEDDPEKIMVYLKNVKEIEHLQEKFLATVQDINSGYFRHPKFNNCEELEKQVIADIVTLTSSRYRRTVEAEGELKKLKSKRISLHRIFSFFDFQEEDQ